MIYIKGGQFTGKLGKVLETLPDGKLRVQIIRKGMGLITTVKPKQVEVIPSFKIG